MTETMRSARLVGIRQMQIDRVPVTPPQAGEIQVAQQQILEGLRRVDFQVQQRGLGVRRAGLGRQGGACRRFRFDRRQ